MARLPEKEELLHSFFIRKRRFRKLFNEEQMEVSNRCKAMYVSNRAYTQILTEVLAHNPNETGGVLLGHEKDGNWYIVEAVDPGLDVMRSYYHHEMDKDYQNHVFTVLSRLYKKDLDLMGLFHRHPGKLNVFSEDDRITNRKFADAIGNGTLSILINICPKMEFTCYYLDKEGNDKYYKVPMYVGDEYFKDNDYLEIKDLKNMRY